MDKPLKFGRWESVRSNTADTNIMQRKKRTNKHINHSILSLWLPTLVVKARPCVHVFVVLCESIGRPPLLSCCTCGGVYESCGTHTHIGLHISHQSRPLKPGASNTHLVRRPPSLQPSDNSTKERRRPAWVNMQSITC